MITEQKTMMGLSEQEIELLRDAIQEKPIKVERICPLMTACQREDTSCFQERCAWWIEHTNCAIKALTDAVLEISYK